MHRLFVQCGHGGCIRAPRYTYDIMGNALSVRRNGLLDDGTYGTVDDLTLDYDGNRLVKVTDTAEGPYRKGVMHYTDGADEQEEFAYDANGNMTRNLDRHICSIRYNSLNLPRRIEFADGSIVRYTYTATGDKLRADYYINPLAASATAGADVPRVDSTSLVHTWRTYAGNRIYDNDSLRMVLVDGGYITLGGGAPRYHFYLRDHLGNNRIVADIDGNVEEVNHYCPYGALMDISTAATQPYKYTGKELDRTHGLDWYDHGARMNDPLTLRWNGVDKRAEEYVPFSPYSVCADNPVCKKDIDGKKIIMYYTDGYGNERQYVFSGINGRKHIKIPHDSFIKDFITAYTYNIKNGGGTNLRKAVESKEDIYLLNGNELPYPETKYSKGIYHVVRWESRKGLLTTLGGKQSPATRLEHEMNHAINNITNAHDYRKRKSQTNTKYDNEEEKNVIEGGERKTALHNKESIRHDHKGKTFDVCSPISIK